VGAGGRVRRRRSIGRGAAALSQTVLVTGGAGFVGASLVRVLAARGDRIRVIDDFSVGQKAYLDGVPADLIEASIGDAAALADAVEGVDAIVHLAARADIVDSIADPVRSFRANVVHTVDLLEAGRRAGARKFVLASTNAVMGAAVPPVDESQVARPISPYGASKLAGEAYCQAYAGAFGMAACALRFSNVYGPFARHKKSVVAAWVRAALDGRPLIVNGAGTQTRDYIFVNDLADAIGRCLDAHGAVVAGQVYQVGTGVETSLNELAVALSEALGRPLAVEHGPARAGDVARNVSRVDKAAEQLGFRAATRIVEGLASTAVWFEAASHDPRLSVIEPQASSGSE
jgi:UDP-glucose 4-epimerase